MESRVFRYSRTATAFYLIGSLTLAAISIVVTLGAGPQAKPTAWMSAGLILSSLALMWNLARPVVMVLDADGFTISGGFRWKEKKVAWREVGEFIVHGTGRGTVAVAYKVPDPARDYGHLADLAGTSTAVRLLPTGWDEKPEPMAAALNSYRRAALDGNSSRAGV